MLLYPATVQPDGDTLVVLFPGHSSSAYQWLDTSVILQPEGGKLSCLAK